MSDELVRDESLWEAIGRPARLWLAGLPVDLIGDRGILDLLDHAVSRDLRIVLANANLHGLYEALGSGEMRELLCSQSTIVHIDGMPIAWAARLSRAPLQKNIRNTHVDLVPKLLTRCAARDWPVVIVGGTADEALQNKEALSNLIPGLRVEAVDGYFELADCTASSKQLRAIERINDLQPALLLVGMGMPRQERWIAARRNQLAVPVIMPVGGFADYFAGRTKMPPRILGRLGVEWIFRLFHDPRRLAFRYLIEPFLMIWRILLATARGARWGREQSRCERS